MTFLLDDWENKEKVNGKERKQKKKKAKKKAKEKRKCRKGNRAARREKLISTSLQSFASIQHHFPLHCYLSPPFFSVLLFPPSPYRNGMMRKSNNVVINYPS